MIGGLGCIWDIMRFMGTKESEADLLHRMNIATRTYSIIKTETMTF